MNLPSAGANTNKSRHLALFVFAFFACFASNSLAQSIDVLAERVRSGSTEQKREALFQIRNLRTEAASRVAIPALTDVDQTVRATAASSVIYLPRDEAARLLIPLLSDKTEFVRAEAAYALGESGSRFAAADLLRVLSKDKAMPVRAAAAAALGKIGDESAVDSLVAVLKRKPGPQDEEVLRRSAARSIGQIAEIHRLGSRQTATPQSFLPEKFKETAFADKPPASSTAFRSAGAILLKVASNTKETDDTRRETAYALGAIGDRSAKAYLMANLTNKDTYLAEICREALLKLAKPE